MKFSFKPIFFCVLIAAPCAFAQQDGIRPGLAFQPVRLQPPAQAPAPAQNSRPCPRNAKLVIISPKDTGEVVDGPVCVGVWVNGLRYSVEFARTVTITAGPNLSAAIAAPPSAGGGLALADTIDNIKRELTTQRNLFLALDQRNAQAYAAVTLAVNALKAVVSQSDDVYRTSGPEGVMGAAREPHLQTQIATAIQADWSATDNIQAKLRALQGRGSDMLLNNPSDPDKATLTAIQTNISALLADIAPMLLSGDKTTAFYKQKSIVEYWNRLIPGLTPDSFLLTTYVTCGITLNQNKQIAVRLLQSDRLAYFDGQALTVTDLKDPFVTVSCPSPFLVSAGVEFRFLKTSTFGLVPSGPSGANQFGITDNQDKIPMPIGLVHVRLKQDATHRTGIYGSFGIAAHTQGSGTAGSAPEYLAGLSIGLFRTMFVTGGWHFGKVSALSGGYKVGDAVPMGVTVAPVTGSYQSGFGLAISFTKP